MIKAIVFDMDGTLYEPSKKYDKKGIVVPDDKEDFFRRVKVFRTEMKFLKDLGKKYYLYLVTSGVKSWQEQKIKRLGFKPYFDGIFIDTGKGKRYYFKKLLRKYKRNEIVVVGDSMNGEIRDANELGIMTIRILRGRKRKLKPQSLFEKPKQTIKSLLNLKKFL